MQVARCRTLSLYMNVLLHTVVFVRELRGSMLCLHAIS